MRPRSRYYLSARRRRDRKVTPAVLAVLQRLAAGEELRQGTTLHDATARIGQDRVNRATVNSLLARRLVVFHFTQPEGFYRLSAHGREVLAAQEGSHVEG